MMEKRLVSIAMCTYNGAKYIREQIESLLSQTYQNLEIIIVDDVSVDDTVAILRGYEAVDKRIKVYVNEKNLGFTQNFSKAISLCHGDFIAPADQDDIWKKEKIETFVNNIRSNILIYSDATLVDENSLSKNQQLIRPENQLISGRHNKAFLFMNCVSGNTLMFKKELLQYILPIPEVSYHDIWIAFAASCVGSITYTDENMIYYRRHQDQVTLHPIKKRNFDYVRQRIRLKADEKMKIASQKIQDFQHFRDLTYSLGDEQTTKLLDLLIDHYKNYTSIVVNYTLKKMLIQYKDELFAIAKAEKRLKRAKRAAFGLKYYLYTFFIL